MNAEIIAVGTELLHGDILNSNAQFISKKMAEIGVDVHYHTVVGDNPNRMCAVFQAAMERVDVVIVTGGLGPTKDDITKEVWGELLDRALEHNPDSLVRMKKRFAQYERPMTENNLRQTYFPKGAQIIPNANGTADACKLTEGNVQIYLLPGPPRETNPLVEEVLVPELRAQSHQTVVYKKIRVEQLGESSSEMLLMDLIDGQSNPTIAPYAGFKQVTYRITAKADTRAEALELLVPLVEEVLKRLAPYATLLEEEQEA